MFGFVSFMRVFFKFRAVRIVKSSTNFCFPCSSFSRLFSVRRHFVPRHFVPGHILSRDNMSPGQYVALCPHYFAVQMGDILSQETYCPGSVRRHFVPGDVLSRLATNGNFWTDIDILRTDIDICLLRKGFCRPSHPYFDKMCFF